MKPFIVLFLVIFALNFGYALVYQIHPAVDAKDYDELAQNLVSRGVYRFNTNVDILEDNAIGLIGPGYEFFLASIYYIFGRYLWIVWAFQAAFYSLSILLLAYLTARLYPEILNSRKFFYGLIIFFGGFIDAIQLNGMLMTESLFILFLVLPIFFFWRWLSDGKPLTFWRGAWLGSLLGILTLIRPNGLLIFLFLAGATIFYYRRRLPILYLAGLVLFFVSVQAPWVIRNYFVYQEFVFHNSAGSLNLLSGNYPGNHGEFTADFDLFKKLKEENPRPLDLERAAAAWYRDFVFSHPVQAAGILLEKLVLFFSLTKTSGFWFHYFSNKDQLATLALSVLQNFFIVGGYFLFLFAGVKKLFSRQPLTKDYIFWALLSFIMIATPVLAVISNRQRLQLSVFLLPMLAYSYLEFLRWDFRSKFIALSLTMALLFVSSGLDVYLQLDKFKERIHRISYQSLNHELV